MVRVFGLGFARAAEIISGQWDFPIPEPRDA